MNTLINDIKYAFRQLRKSPGFACATVLILALGIGGVTAMFSTLYTVMIKPLPYTESGRLVLGRATFSGSVNPWVSAPDYWDYHDKGRCFASLEAFFASTEEVTITTGRSAERADSLIVSVGLFPTLGMNMFLGRPFTAEEGLSDAPHVAIVSHAYWQKHLAAQTDVIGRSLVIDGIPYDLIGVTPPDFNFIYDVDVWLPMRPNSPYAGARSYHTWFVLGRLKEDVTLAEAQSNVDVISAQLEQTYPDSNTNKALLLTPLQKAFTQKYCASFAMLCAGAGATLLIACANAAGLLLARGAGRQGELAVRAAMGASRWRLMRLLLTEALVVAGIAGTTGTFLAVWIQGAMLHLMPIETLLLGAVGLSRPVFLFVLVTTLLTGLTFGILPAWRSRYVNVAQDLRASGRGTLQHSMGVRGGLVMGQVMLSFLLLVVAGLLIRSFTWLHGANPGFNSRNLLTVEIPLPRYGYPAEQRPAFFTSLLDGVRSIPTVVSAAAISQLPLRDPYNSITIYAAYSPPTNSINSPSGNQRIVLPSYFETMGIPLLAGRDIQPTDTQDTDRVVVISQCLAETLFPDRDPLGQQVVISMDNTVVYKVVGVVGNVKADSLYEQTISRGTFYEAYGQHTPCTMRLAIRTAGDPLLVVAPLRTLLQKMDPQIPLSGPRTMEDIMANSTVSYKAISVYLTTLSLLALALAATGIYGLLAYIVTQRRRDIGIRMAVGAEPCAILGMVLHSGMKLVVIGIGLGLVGAFALTRLLQSQLFGVAAWDPLTFIAVTFVLVAVASLACYVPARRAAKIDPMEALRYE